jgi:mannose-6-phosphate isomerase-like protein (cupin superfamily)
MPLQGFHYELPDEIKEVPKCDVVIARTEKLSAAVQVVGKGGETNLHAHNGEDAVWLVIGGAASFYDGEGHKLNLREHDFVFIPGGTKYWFESASEAPLEILRVASKDPSVGSSRSDFGERARINKFGHDPKIPATAIALVPES